MNIFRAIWSFIQNGSQVFSKAARGQYVSPNPEIEEMRRELERNSKLPGAAIDKANLMRDRSKVYQDISEAFNQYKLSH